jgi:hypothetical protein
MKPTDPHSLIGPYRPGPPGAPSVIASTSGSAPAEKTPVNATSQAIGLNPSMKGSAAKQTAMLAQDPATMPRWAPKRSAIQPHAAGATMRAICGAASTSAIPAASRPREAR